MNYRVHKSDDGRMAVQSKYDDFVASFHHGEWVDEMVFGALELEGMPQVEDDQEVLVIVKEAKKALCRL